MTPSAVIQSNQIQGNADPKMVQDMTDPLRVVTEEKGNEPIVIEEAENSQLLNDGNSNIYGIENSIRAFLELVKELQTKSPARNGRQNFNFQHATP